MKNTFKENLDALSYDEILEHQFRDLEYSISEFAGETTIYCTFTMSKTVWDSYRKSGSLGHIYNCDLSNYLHRKGVKMFYAVPVVDDRGRAKAGIKTISVEFRSRNKWE